MAARREGAGGDTVHVVWQDETTGYADTYYRARTSSGFWLPYDNISRSNPAYEHHPELTVDGAGVAHVAWLPGGGLYGDAYYAAGTSGAWTNPVEASNNLWGALASSRPMVDDTGTVHLAWFDHAQYANVWYGSKPGGGSWSNSEQVSHPALWQSALWPALAVDSNRVPHVIWQEGDVRYSAKVGGAWTTPIPISSEGGAWYARLAADGLDGLHAAWQTDDIWYAAKPAGGAWGSPENPSNNWGYSQNAELAVEGNGAAHMVWQDNTPGNDDVYYYYIAGSGPSPTPTPTATPTSTPHGHTIADAHTHGHSDADAYLYTRTD